MTPEGTKIVMERRKRDAESAKRQKELAALAGKQTKALKEQTALTKAKMVLDKTSAVFNLDLIQNTAALQGKITEDETLRLKLQREILLGNADAAGKLAQELLSVQIAAMMAASVDPFGNYAKSAIEAMKSLLDLRKALSSLGAPQVISGAELLAQDYADALADANDPQFNLPSSSPMQDYQDAFSRPNTANSFNNVVISIDPTAAQYGISAAVVNNASNGNSNDFRRTGTGF
jgi:delta 1-pyrroline-5-carboxylate dehydrogenase